MPIYLRIMIEPGVDESIVIRNVGHPETGDHPEDDDLRKYVISAYNPPPVRRCAVEHRRSDGRHVLISKSMEALRLL